MKILDCPVSFGYPAGWLVALLNERGIRYSMRCDKANWVAMRALLSSGKDHATVTLKAPDRQDALAYECSGQAPQVRLVCPRGGCRWAPPTCPPKASRAGGSRSSTTSASALRRGLNGSSTAPSCGRFLA
ncbi:hypothetical protein [Xenophilus azovorans]|uniref:hypothetical protein n=1 Tax=Xenophilus azovorans TaxID=151755 RepID=UPI0012EEA7EA|nr:hypothetical protein [Xenophilus azovorans]